MNDYSLAGFFDEFAKLAAYRFAAKIANNPTMARRASQIISAGVDKVSPLLTQLRRRTGTWTHSLPRG
jgi:hypothetical protein